MFELRHILVCMRLGESDRALANAGLIGRPKAKALRTVARERGWLDPARPLPDDAVLAQVFGNTRPAVTTPSCVESYRDVVIDWAEQGIQSKTIYQALVRNHAFGCSYSSVYRFVRALMPTTPKATMHLEFAPGEAVQVYFGAGAVLVDVRTGEEIKTWFFIMTPCWSRHQYAELILNQKVDTWLACHRHAFDWFVGAMISMTAMAYYAMRYAIATKPLMLPEAFMGVAFPAIAAR